MGYYEETIKNVLSKIENGKLFLPAIQRKFVWSEEQITKLFDSLMRGYPIGTFLFWDIDKEKDNIKNYVFYDFIKEYHERDTDKNPIRKTIIKNNFKVAIDGQQRITSLYISLMGSLSIKKPRKHWSNDDSFPKKELYLNLSSELSEDDDDDDEAFEFKFIDPREIPNDNRWFKVKEVLDFKDTTNLVFSKAKEDWRDSEVKRVSKLWEVICNQKCISYFSVMNVNIDQVLDIFVRINSAGTVLSKSDLIFSTLIASWPQGREQIDSLIKNINRPTIKFSFNNNFVMRVLLYINDLPINLKVESFKNNVPKIIENYKDIEKSIKAMVSLIEENGFSNKNITSYNSLIPIVYFIYKKGDLDRSKQELIKYFIIAQLKNLFGVASNAALNETRKSLVIDSKSFILKEKLFKMKQFHDITLTGDRNFKFGEEELDKLFEHSKGKYTFMILSLLYPEIKISEVEFHQDHMHPVYDFSEDSLSSNKFSSEDIKHLISMKDQLPNLQLLKGKENERKNKTSLKEWMSRGKEKDIFLTDDISLELRDFKKFYEQRKKLMKKQLEIIFDTN